ARVERAEAEAILDGDRETAVALLLRVGELVAANQRLEARVAELERRLNRSSRNSSLPPSQDPPSAPPRAGGKRSGRGRGGQPGHEGRHRRLLPPEQVDEVVEHSPARCRSCAHHFGEPERVDAAEPSRHQVAELPPIVVRVTEHRLHRVCCPACAAQTRAELPAGSRSAFGPRLQAAVVTLAVRNRVSRRDTTELARELFGVELATGSVDAIIQRAGEALAAPHTRLEQQLKAASVVNIDDTGWKTAGGRRTLWGALTYQRAVFRIAAGRHASESRMLLGERFAGIVCSDRWRGYDYLDPVRRQLCWAHLLRDFTAHSEGMGEQQRFGNDGLQIAHHLFHRLGRLPTRWRPGPPQRRDRAAASTAPHAARTRGADKRAHQVPPAVREEPPQPLAGALDLHPHRRGRADQQPRRTRPPRRRHLPQALTRQPIRTRRAHHRTTPLRLGHLQAAPPVALRLPEPSPHRPRPRRPNTNTQLTTGP
ncbi:MAG TPA: transposase, partial [Gaiellaceae bacterium]